MNKLICENLNNEKGINLKSLVYVNAINVALKDMFLSFNFM